MFEDRFVPLVKSRTKRQTFRVGKKRRIQAGMIADCRRWKGLAYRSKQESICEGKIASVRGMYLDWGVMVIWDGFDTIETAAEEVAKNDGFSSFREMLIWVEKTHGLPCSGRLITWEFSAP